jgi:hypothetical protein
VLLAVLALGALTACAGPAGSRQPVPTFAPEQAAQSAAPSAARATVLPTDCEDVVSGHTMSALLGKPIDSVSPHTVRGVAAASVGRLERVSCQYRVGAGRTALPAVEMNLAAYNSGPAADHQLSANAAEERAAAQHTEEFPIGSARAVLAGEPGKSVLLVASGQVAVTMTLRDGVVPAEQTRPVMVDLAQRVLPKLGPARGGPAR